MFLFDVRKKGLGLQIHKVVPVSAGGIEIEFLSFHLRTNHHSHPPSAKLSCAGRLSLPSLYPSFGLND